MNDNTNMKPVNTTDNQVLVIFGANGDLSHRKLLPALYNLFYDNLLPEKFAVIGSERPKNGANIQAGNKRTINCLCTSYGRK